jgi:Flp pilus assembly protein TadB
MNWPFVGFAACGLLVVASAFAVYWLTNGIIATVYAIAAYAFLAFVMDRYQLRVNQRIREHFERKQ